MTIYNCDYREIMPSLTRGGIDLVITDPPYGMEYHSGRYIGANPHPPITNDDRYPAEIVPVLRGIARKAVFLFCRWDNLPEVEPPKSFIAMIKNSWTAGDLNGAFARQWEGILFYPCEEFSFNTRLPDVIDCRRVPPANLLHPTQKPEYPIGILLQACSNANDLVFDPFLGSGTTAFCAKKLNRYSIGIEIEEKYCEIAAKRCSQEVMELNFNPNPENNPAGH